MSTAPVPRWTRGRFAFYAGCRALTTLAFGLLYRHFTRDADRLPARGPVLVVANHQSYFDPPVLATRLNRPVNFVARSGLFRVPILRWIIMGLGATPIREDGSDTRAMRVVLALLEEGHVVALFPEGTRTLDGRVSEFKRGLISIIKRAKCPVMPMALEGAFDAWPRQRTWPVAASRDKTTASVQGIFQPSRSDSRLLPSNGMISWP